jgi:hypothetical protein
LEGSLQDGGISHRRTDCRCFCVGRCPTRPRAAEFSSPASCSRASSAAGSTLPGPTQARPRLAETVTGAGRAPWGAKCVLSPLALACSRAFDATIYLAGRPPVPDAQSCSESERGAWPASGRCDCSFTRGTPGVRPLRRLRGVGRRGAGRSLSARTSELQVASRERQTFWSFLEWMHVGGSSLSEGVAVGSPGGFFGFQSAQSGCCTLPPPHVGISLMGQWWVEMDSLLPLGRNFQATTATWTS